MKAKKETATHKATAQQQSKDNQTNVVFQCIRHEPKTRRQIEAETGIHNNTIDWIVDDLIKHNNAFVAYKGKCSISGYSSSKFVTSNEAYRPKLDAIQPSLFS
jgi:hypothetical protein